MFNRSIKHHLDFLTVKKQKLSPERPRSSRTENEGGGFSILSDTSRCGVKFWGHEGNRLIGLCLSLLSLFLQRFQNPLG